MEKNDFSRFSGPGQNMWTVLGELSLIEQFSASNLVPDEHWLVAEFVALGFILYPDRKEKNVNACFIEATYPPGWVKRLCEAEDYRIDLIDAKGHLRGYFCYKPGEYAHTTFICRYEYRFRRVSNVQTSTAGWVVVWDNMEGREQWNSGVVAEGNWRHSRDVAMVRMWEYMQTAFPGFESPSRYWD